MNRARRATLPLLLVLAACRGQAPLPAAERPYLETEGKGEVSALGLVGADRQNQAAESPAPRPAATVAPPSAPGGRMPSLLKLIFTASLQIEVPAFRAAAEEAGRVAVAMGGYVSDRQSSEDGAGRERGQITLRVPSERSTGR